MTRPASPTLSVLLLADDQRGHPNAIHDHIQAFRRYSRHRVELFNPRGLRRSRFLNLDHFDVVVIHYSIVVVWDEYLSPDLRSALAAYDGLKVQFLQDEYRFVDAVTAEMRRLGIDVLYSVVPEHQQGPIYGGRLPNTEVLSTLTGYVPRGLVGRSVPPVAARPVDVGYRGRALAFWLGRLGQEKLEIGRGFLDRCAGSTLKLDIAWTEGARIYGEDWNAFISSCRATLGSESGSSLVDFDGSIERLTREYIAANPELSYDDAERDLLSRFAGGPSINAASPRIFESAALRTAMIMFPGEYSGVVRPWDHYIPLEKDFSNLEDVVEHLRDHDFLEGQIERAYDDLIGSGRYSDQAWIASFDSDLDSRATPRNRLRHFPARRLAFEQAAVGRGYHVSALYDVVRHSLLAYLGAREVVRHAALRRLALRAMRSKMLREDVFRLAVLTSIQTGRFRPREPFTVLASYDDEAGRLTLMSTDSGVSHDNSAVERAVRESISNGTLREIAWNHVAVGQYVSMPVPLIRQSLAFDVGRYDTYGLHRFRELVALAPSAPQLVSDALTALLGSPREARPTYHAPPTGTESED